MLYQLFLTVAVMAVLMGGYYVVQRGLRRLSPEVGPECDVLETRWGCGGCLLHGKCRKEFD